MLARYTQRRVAAATSVFRKTHWGDTNACKNLHGIRLLSASAAPAAASGGAPLVHPIVAELEALIIDRWNKMDAFDFEAYNSTSHDDITMDLYDMTGLVSTENGGRIMQTRGLDAYSHQFATIFASWEERDRQIKHKQEAPTWFRVETDGDVTVRVHFTYYDLPKSGGVSVEDMLTHPDAFAAGGYHDYRLRSLVPGSTDVADWRIIDFQNFVEKWGDANLKWLLSVAE